MAEQHVGDLEIDQDLQHQETSWIVQRIAWVALVAIIVSALLGAWGHGLLADARAGSATSALDIEYDRVVRHRADATLHLLVSSDETQSESVDVSIDIDWLSSISIEAMIPEPESSSVTRSVVTYTFAITVPGHPVHISIDYMPVDIGRTSGSVAVGEREPVSFSQFVFP